MNTLMPYILSFIGVFCYSVLPPLAKKALPEIPPLAFMTVATFLLGLFSLIGSFTFERNFSFVSMRPQIWGALLVYVLVNLFGFLCEMIAIKKIPVTEYELINIVSPIITAAFAYFLLSEPFKLRYLVGLTIMGAGLFIALYDPAKS